MRGKIFSVALIVIFMAGLMGCASTSSVNSTLAPTVSFGNFKTISVNVQTKVEDSDKEAKTFREILTAELKKKNKWEVPDGNPQCQLELSATITNLNKVGGASRIFLGALAGQASVDIDVVVRDAKGKVVSQFTASGKSSGGTIFAGTTDQALEKAAAQIAAFMDTGK